MKNIFKKNHIIITALAIMIVIAGYLSFTSKDTPKDKDIADSMSDVDTDEYGELDGLDYVEDTMGNVADADGADAEATGTSDTDAAASDEETTPVDTDASGETSDISDEDIMTNAQDVSDNGELNLEDGVPGEAVLANNTIDAGFFISSKLDREQVRAKNKETLMDIIESESISEEDKKAAIESMIQLTERAEKESAAEMLLEAKGFDGAVVFMVDDEVNVVVNASNLTDQQLAIIEDVVKKETDVTVDKIHINPVVVEE